MKKLTVKVAKKLSNNNAGLVNTFQDAINYIVSHAKIGYNSCFLEGNLNILKTIKKELEERGFVCFLDSNKQQTVPYMTVEWN